MYAQLGALIFATSLVQLANGFFTTLVSLRLAIQDFNPAFEGAIMSAYFVGFTCGSVACGGVIQRIGHIRSYAAFAGIFIAATAGMNLFVHPLAWALLRMAIGFGCVGLFVATESWLNAKATPAARGTAFAVYMVGTFLALALGQLLIGRLPIEGSVPFNLIMALFAIALVIVSLTRAEPPMVGPEPTLPYGALTRAAPLAALGALVAGMISATFYAVVPAWMLAQHLTQETIGLVMLSAVLGGLAFQLPVGFLSDRMDRRLLLGALAVGLASSASALVFLPHTFAIVLPAAALLGGFMSTLYPVCVALALDRMAGERVVAVSGRLILVSGLGSTAGPITGSWIMSYLDLDGVLYFLAIASAVLAVAALVRSAEVRTQPSTVPFKDVAVQALRIAPHENAATVAASRSGQERTDTP